MLHRLGAPAVKNGDPWSTCTRRTRGRAHTAQPRYQMLGRQKSASPRAEIACSAGTSRAACARATQCPRPAATTALEQRVPARLERLEIEPTGHGAYSSRPWAWVAAHAMVGLRNVVSIKLAKLVDVWRLSRVTTAIFLPTFTKHLVNALLVEVESVVSFGVPQ